MEGSGRPEVAVRLPTSEAPYHDLWTKPFRESTDPGFLWLGPPYRDAFVALRAGVLENRGILLLTGEVGTGKTMLACALADSLRAEGVNVARLADAGLTAEDLRHGVARALSLPSAASDAPQGFLIHLGDCLREAYARRQKVLLVIDEAQNLGPALLDEIEQLARAGREAGRGKVNVLNILLVGQASLEAALRRRDAVGVRARLGPLGAEEVADYVAFRLRAAGADRELFSAQAIQEIGTAAGGVPRLVNQICDCALLVASQRSERKVSVEVVRDAMSEWGLTGAAAHAGRGGGRRWLARRGIRRIAYAAALIFAIGLGGVVYHSVNAAKAGNERRERAETRGPGVHTVADDMPPAAMEPAAVGPATATRPAAEARPSGAAKEPHSGPAAEPRSESVRSARATAVRPATVKRVERSSGPAEATSARRTPAGRSEEPDDPTAIIDWLLGGTRPAAER